VNQMLTNQTAPTVVEAPAPRIETRATVVADVDLPIGTELNESHLRVVELPLNAFPVNSFIRVEDTLANPPVTVMTPISEGEVVIAPRLSTGILYRGITGRITEGKRGISIPVNAVRGVGGFVLPGDRIDVLHTTTIGRRDNQPVTRTLLQDLTVLAIDQTNAEDFAEPTLVNVVTLLATQEEAKTLTLALEVGTLTLTLRSGLDHEEDESRTIALSNLWTWGPQDLGSAAGQQGRAPAPPPSNQVQVIRGLIVNEETVTPDDTSN
ncbi:MAG: Flp pilus assembly protein CpaB, partial [Pseudohongiella sp.]